MDVKVCRECGTLIKDNNSSSLCNYCAPKDEENFQILKDYLQKNPGATTADVCRETGVTIKQIRNYLEEGRLSATKGSI